MQEVNLGITQSGRHGLFTGGFLAWPLKPEEYERFMNDRAALEMYCTRLNFKLV